MSAATELPARLIEVRGDMVLAALCIGQFHAPCQICPQRLVILADEPLMRALAALGLELRDTDEPFTPAPFFAPESALEGAGARQARRQVRSHGFHDHAEDAPEENEGRGSNA